MVEVGPAFIQQVFLLVLLRLLPRIELQQKLAHLFSSLLVVLEQVGLVEAAGREQLQSGHVGAVGELCEVESGEDVVEHAAEMPVLLLREVSVFLDEFGQPAE